MTRRRLILYIVTGCLVYAVALLAMLPAPWVSHVIESASHHKLLLRDAAGTVWTGSGRLYARQRSGDLIDLGPLRWSTAPSALLQGELAADVALNDAASPVHLEFSPGSVTIRDVKLELPGKLLAIVAPPLEVLGPEGEVRVRSDNLRIDGNSILGMAEIEWRQIRLARANGIELGSHVARLRGGGRKVDVELATLEGPVTLEGGGTWSQAAGLAISGTVEPHAAAVVPFLKGVCSEYRDSRCLFQIKY